MIVRLDARNVADARRIDGSFLVDARLVLHASDDAIRTTVAAVAPRVKRYETANYRRYVDKPDRIAFLAYAEGQPVGVIAACKPWNGYGEISEFLVDAGHRRSGVGRALMSEAIAWARKENLPGLMLET